MVNVPTTKMQPRAIIYTRVSTTEQSCERQEIELKALCKQRGYDVVQVFREVASGALSGRRQRRRVLRRARDGICDVIVVTELTRWGRSLRDLLDTLEHLQKWGCNLVVANGHDVDMSTPSGRFIVQIMAAMAEFERALARERTISSVDSRRRRDGTRARLGGRPRGKRKALSLARKAQGLRRLGFSYMAISRHLQCNYRTARDACAVPREEIHRYEGRENARRKREKHERESAYKG